MRKGFGAIRQYFKDIVAEGTRIERHDIKGVLLGDAGAGKTRCVFELGFGARCCSAAESTLGAEAMVGTRAHSAKRLATQGGAAVSGISRSKGRSE